MQGTAGPSLLGYVQPLLVILQQQGVRVKLTRAIQQPPSHYVVVIVGGIHDSRCLRLNREIDLR